MFISISLPSLILHYFIIISLTHHIYQLTYHTQTITDMKTQHVMLMLGISSLHHVNHNVCKNNLLKHWYKKMFLQSKNMYDWSWYGKTAHIVFFIPFRRKWCFVCIIYLKSMSMRNVSAKKNPNCFTNGRIRRDLTYWAHHHCHSPFHKAERRVSDEFLDRPQKCFLENSKIDFLCFFRI